MTTESGTCDLFYVDRDRVKMVETKLDDATHIHELAETFKLLGDPTRLNIILALKEAELCVCDLATLLGVTRSAISHQLRLLKNLRLVKYRRQGKIAYYSLLDSHIYDLLEVALEHVRE